MSRLINLIFLILASINLASCGSDCPDYDSMISFVETQAKDMIEDVCKLCKEGKNIELMNSVSVPISILNGSPINMVIGGLVMAIDECKNKTMDADKKMEFCAKEMKEKSSECVSKTLKDDAYENLKDGKVDKRSCEYAKQFIKDKEAFAQIIKDLTIKCDMK